MADPVSYTTPDPTVRELLATHPHLTLNPMDGLMLEDVPLNAIADAAGTPTWVVSAGVLRARARRLRAGMQGAGLSVAPYFAVKSNDHLAVLRILAAEGFGADVVSGGELARARAAGIDPAHIVFSGVGKTEAELRFALDQSIAQINVESVEELHILSAITAETGQTARIVLRVNPDVDAGTHDKITTGRADNKFGIPYADAARLHALAGTLPGIMALGFAVHIGSQITTMEPYRTTFARMAQLVRDVREAGGRVEVIDCGGGLGITYRDEIEGSPEALAGAIRAELGDLDVRLAMEPGRWIAAPAGVLLSTVVLNKAVEDAPPFVVLDAAMNDLLRPSLYDAWHGILPLSPHDAVQPLAPAHFVGQVCESGDVFAKDRLSPPLARGARVALLDTGAYGAVMSSTYNARPMAAQVLVDGERWSVIRERQSVESLWRDEIQPPWLAERS